MAAPIPVRVQLGNQADAGGTCEDSYSVPIAKAWQLQRMIAMGNSDVVPPSAPGSIARFRGNWSGSGQLLYAQDFSASAALPPEFTAYGTFARVLANTFPGDSGGAIYAGQASGPAGTSPGLVLEIAKVPALAGQIITRVVSRYAYQAAARNGTWAGTAFKYDVDGTTLQTSDLQSNQIGPWTGTDHAINPQDSISWRYDGTFAYPTVRPVAVTGIQIYGMDAESAYNLNDVVSYNATLWQSKKNMNLSEPGTNGDWEQIAGVEVNSGMPLLRVYRNGELIDATGNANEDISDVESVTLQTGDMVRAAWSNCSPGAHMALLLAGETIGTGS